MLKSKKKKPAAPDAAGIQKMKLGPEELSNSPKTLLSILERSIPLLKGRVDEKDLEALASRDTRSIEEILLYLTEAVHFTNMHDMFLSRDALIANAAQILQHEPLYVFRLSRCVESFHSDLACDAFLSMYFPNMGKNIYWKPFVDKLNEYDEESQIGSLLFEDDFNSYLKQWDRHVVIADEADYRFGFSALPELEVGRAMKVEVGEDSSFSTTSDGKITIPPYVNLYQSKRDNLENYHVSFWHEIGHHKWKSFQINMDPEVFDYQAFGISYVKHHHAKGSAVITVEKDGKEFTIEKFEDLLQLAKQPRLLLFLHNVIEDGRVDSNNIRYCKGLADEYRRDNELLFEKRPELKDDSLSTLLEAILQYAIAGRLASEMPKGLSEKFSFAKEAIDKVENGFHTDGTDSINAAIRIYNMLMGELKDLLELLSEMPASFRGSTTEINSSNPPLIIVEPRSESKDAKGGVKGGKGKGQKQSGGQYRKDGMKKRDGSLPTYDGWDGENLVEDEHVIYERPAEGEVIEAPLDEIERMKRIFKRYAPKVGVLERGLEEGDIDPELLQEFMQDVRCGKLRERNFYSRVVYEERDVATGVLIDLSGSTYSIRKEILKACTILGIASSVLGDPLVIAGFTTGFGEGYSTEDFIVMKELWEKEIRNSDEGGATPMGGPMRHMCFKMSRPGIREKGFKQIFLITDGEANVGKAPLEDAAKSVEEAWGKNRIRTFGIGITEGWGKERMEECFDQIFGVGNYLIVSQKDVADGTLHVFFEGYYRRMANKLR